MNKRRLGKSGLEVSEIGLGCNNFGGRIDEAASQKVIHRCLDLGVTFFDTADVYGNRGGSEEIIGKVLGPRRAEVTLATKFAAGMSDDGSKRGGSRRYIIEAIEASLRRLNTDHIDLYQMHTPDADTPIEETVRALDDLIRQGKVRYVGCSNFASWQLVDALWASDRLGLNAMISCQDEYSLLRRNLEKEAIPAMANHGIGLLPYFPLASGLLTGKYRKGEALPEGTRFAGSQGLQDRYMTESAWDVVEKLRAFAEAHDHSLLDLAFAWLLAKPTVSSVIAGATKPEQIEANAKAAEWILTPEQVAKVDAIAA